MNTPHPNPLSIQLHLRYFASLREQLDCTDEPWITNAQTVGELRQELMRRPKPWGEALANPALRVAYDHVLCTHDQALSHGGEVAFFPPVTGG